MRTLWPFGAVIQLLKCQQTAKYEEMMGGGENTSCLGMLYILLNQRISFPLFVTTTPMICLRT